MATYSLVERFELGFAGLTDYIGITHDAAAHEYAVQTARAQRLNPTQAAQLDADAVDAEENDDVLDGAVDLTIGQVHRVGARVVEGAKSAAEAVGDEVGHFEGSTLSPLILPACIVLAGLFLWFVGPAIAPTVKALLPKKG